MMKLQIAGSSDLPNTIFVWGGFSTFEDEEESVTSVEKMFYVYQPAIQSGRFRKMTGETRVMSQEDYMKYKSI